MRVDKEGFSMVRFTWSGKQSGDVIDPKKAIAKHQPIKERGDKMMGSDPSNFGDNCARAGMIPTNPAARGIVPIDVAVVWSKTCGSNHTRADISLEKPHDTKVSRNVLMTYIFLYRQWPVNKLGRKSFKYCVT